MYKANSVFWNLHIDVDVKEVDDPTYEKEFFELNWGMYFLFLSIYRTNTVTDIKGAKNHSILINAYKQISDANLDSRTVMESIFNVDSILFSDSFFEVVLFCFVLFCFDSLLYFASWLAFNYLIANHGMTLIFKPQLLG